MPISRDLTRLPMAVRGGVAALDSFDALNLGQQAVAAKAAGIAAGQGVVALAVAWPLPEAVPGRLLSLRATCRELAAQGIGHLHLPRGPLGRPGQAGFGNLLVERLAVRQIVVAAESWTPEDLESIVTLGQKLGLDMTLVEPVMVPDGQVCGSDALRAALAAGAPERAAALLGRPWEIEGRVREGDRRGRTIGFPTANLSLGAYLQPALGVYAVRVLLDRPGETRWHDGAANLGRRPTVDGQEVRLEVHLFDFAGDLYGARLRVQLLAYLRGEKKFDGLDGLQAQIAADCQAAREILRARA